MEKQGVVLVTGANGYIGQGVVKQLLDDGVKVVAADLTTDHVDSRAVSYQGDIFSIDDPIKKLTYHGIRAEIVLHLAWRNGFVHNAPSHIEDIPRHYSFLECVACSGIKQLAVMGSMHEVGFWEGSIREDTPTNPQSLYGIGKDTLRKCTLLLAEQNAITCQWIRGYYIVGNTEFGSSIFSKITLAEKQGKKEFPFTQGQNQWDFIDYDEFCRQVAAIVEQDAVNGIINACSGHPQKLCERVEQFIQDNQYNIKLGYGQFPDRPYDSKAVWGDNKKILKIMEKYHGHGE